MRTKLLSTVFVIALSWLPAAAAIVGDVNGDGAVNITDATLTQQIAAEATAPTAAQKTAADVNRDGRVDVNDATLIQKFAADVIRSFE